MKALFSEFGRENAIVGKRVAIHLARRLFRQLASRSPIITGIHLVVAFVAMEGPAKRLRRRTFFRLQPGQSTQKHVYLEHGAFVGAIRSKKSSRKLCQDVPAKAHQ